MKGKRALVLGGGGGAGNAWEIGIIAGLHEGGLDVGAADLIIGTSAGATVAAQISCTNPSDLYAAILAAPVPTAPPRPGAPPRPVVDQMERTARIIAESQDAADMRRRMGAAAIDLAGASDASRQSQWRAITASRLPSELWPDRYILITAVDAHTGEGVTFDRHSGVKLADAVAASTSSGPAYHIGDNWYIDGGYRRNENADLAAGYERVLVLSPFGGRSRHPQEWGLQLAAQVAELKESGSSVETILPDSRLNFGANVMDPALRLPAAQAGYGQGKALASQLYSFWL